jgi:hypothetical protein
MTADYLRQFITAVPFKPFNLRTIDGRKIPVWHRDFILITPTQTHVFVFQPNDAFEMIDLALLPSLEVGPPIPETPPKPSDTAA